MLPNECYRYIMGCMLDLLLRRRLDEHVLLSRLFWSCTHIMGCDALILKLMEALKPVILTSFVYRI